MTKTTTCVELLESFLEKAKVDELSSVCVIGIRKNVTTGGVGYIASAGDLDVDNSKILNSLRMLWQGGKNKWDWPALQIDREFHLPARPAKRTYVRRE